MLYLMTFSTKLSVFLLLFILNVLDQVYQRVSSESIQHVA